jgi:AraC-like DNA-binding protein
MTSKSAEVSIPPRIRVSTEELPEQDRLAIWQEVHGRTLFNVGVRPDSETPYNANVDIRPIHGGAIGAMTSSRSQYYLAKDYLKNAQDTLTIFLIKDGRIRGRQRGKEALIGPDQAFFILNNETVTLDVLEDSAALNLYISVPAVASLVPDLGRALLEPSKFDPGALKLLANYANTLHRLEAPMSPDQLNMMSSHVFDLVANALGCLDPREERTQGGIGAARRQAIKADIADNLAQFDLSPDMTAQRLGISPRYLSKLLREDGTSYLTLLRHMRIQKAYQLLTDQRQIHRPISAVAYEIGFNDLSHFNRSFRRQYGMTPGDVRNNALRGS